MNRYVGIPKVFDREEGRLVSGFRITPNIDPVYTVVINVEENDTMESLAFQYYGSSKLWWIVADANALVDPLSLTAGTKIRIVKRQFLTGERLGPR